MHFRFRRCRTKSVFITTARVPLPACVPPACDDLLAMPKVSSPLLAELMAIYCHTRPIGALSQSEHCVNEYQMTARSIINHLLEGWQNQTQGQGSIDDLLLAPRTVRPALPSTRCAENPVSREHRLAS
ncbi:hypothetical protein [Streptomyces melanogenes]|uniref:hypothetical protein n=1 Tax=Streptomyces melanogenes TaxID=67326 RepID=UPI0037BAA4EE